MPIRERSMMTAGDLYRFFGLVVIAWALWHDPAAAASVDVRTILHPFSGPDGLQPEGRLNF